MSGSSYDDSRGRSKAYEGWYSSDSTDRVKAVSDHRREVAQAREKVTRGEVTRPPTVTRDVAKVQDASLARNRITSPPKDADRAIVVLADNSGSNRKIAQHMRDSSGHLTGLLRGVDAGATIAFNYFSDHGDRDRAFQEVDFVTPTEAGDKVLFNSLRNVGEASGQDIPEALECALMRAAAINFGHIQRKNRMLVVVTDSVAHGMGCDGDEGCPDQVDWRQSMADVRETYGQFVLIGSGCNPNMSRLQRKLFETAPGVSNETEVALNFIDLSAIKSSDHRNGIVGNALLFAIARNVGPQGACGFLATLYSKWLASPVFGKDDTDRLARERIRSFAELYLPGIMTPEEIQTALRDILAE